MGSGEPQDAAVARSGNASVSRRRLWRKLVLASLFMLVIFTGAAYGLYVKVVADAEPLRLEDAKAVSVTVVDRNDRLLRAFTTADDKWRLPIEPTDVDPHYIKMLLAFEDKRFYSHHGVDPRAMVRAVLQFARSGHIVSGGSTLTMQVARLLSGKHERTIGGKLRQMMRALQLERTLSKTEILKLYLRLAPFGGNLEGVRAASLAYFGKEPRRLSLSQAALLVALPQSPEERRLDTDDAGRAPSVRQARAHDRWQAQADGARAPARTGAFKNRNLETLPSARTLRRQS
jgi:penicillin-binding protein 1C